MTQIKIVGLTHKGLVRKTNQDYLYFDEDKKFLVVADGIGGRQGGETASRMAVDGIKNAIINADIIRHEEINQFLLTTIEKINQRIYERGKTDEKVKGLGTTTECLMFVGDKLYGAHIGDSRTYLFYRNHLWQLTFDHNVKNFIRRGLLPKNIMKDSAKNNAAKANALTRSLGLTANLDIDTYELNLKPGFIFLTCSDGLTAMVDDPTISTIISSYADDVNVLPEILIREANERGGRDNITVTVVKVVD